MPLLFVRFQDIIHHLTLLPKILHNPRPWLYTYRIRWSSGSWRILAQNRDITNTLKMVYTASMSDRTYELNYRKLLYNAMLKSLM